MFRRWRVRDLRGSRGQVLGLLLIVVVVVAGLVLGGGRLGRRSLTAGHGPGASASPSGFETASPSAGEESSPPTPSAPGATAPAGHPPPPPPPSNGIPHCAANQVHFAITTDRGGHGSYRQGESVVFPMSITNTSSVTCDVDKAYLRVQVYDSAGNYVMAIYAGVGPVEASPYTSQYHYVLRPGASATENDCAWSTDAYRDPHGGPYNPGRAPVGTYHAVGHWQYPQVDDGPLYFNVTAGPSPSPSAHPSPSSTPILPTP